MVDDYADMLDFRNGDHAALTRIIKEYNRPLLYFANKLINNAEAAEEQVSDSFVKLWQGRTHFQTPDNIKAFLYITTKNACLNYIKTPHAKQYFEHEMSDDLLSEEPEVYARIVQTELMQAIHVELEKLPEKQRAVFRLSFLEGLTTDEVCEELNMTPSAVFANKSRAMDALKKVFKDKNMLWCVLLFESAVK